MCGENGQTSGQSGMAKINEQRKGVQELFHKSEDHALNINLCVKFA